jgi:hypothetical protein
MANNSTNKKFSSFEAIMKNDNFAKLLKEAAEAPIGSTKRAKAKSLLAVLQKVDRKKDGKGGMPQNIPIVNQRLQRKTRDYSNLFIFDATPEIRTPIGSKPKYDGAGGPGDTFFSMNLKPQAPLALNLDSMNKTGGATTYSGYTPPVSASQAISSNPIPGMYNNIKTTPLVKPTSYQSTGVEGDDTSLQSGTQDSGGYTDTGSTDTSGNGDYFSQIQNSVDEYSKGIASKYPGLQDAVDSGTGAKMFAYSALGKGSDYLKTLPGFESLPATSLNGPATLSGRYDELEKATRKANMLDEFLNQYNNKAKVGTKIESNLNDYIRGRDEFLNETDALLEKFKDQTLKMDLADPTINKSAQQYSNFLYELRGRQNKRYVEYVKTSVEEYNGQVETAKNMYNLALDNYKSDLQTKGAILQEEYNTMFGALTEMYETVSNAPAKGLELLKAQQELYTASIKAAKDAAAITSESSGQNQIYKDLEDAKAIDSEGRWIPNNYSILGVSNPLLFVPTMLDAGRKAMTMLDKDGNPPSEASIKQISANLKSNLDNVKAGGLLSENDYNSFLRELSSYTNSSFLSKASQTVKGEEVRSAINYLSLGKNSPSGESGDMSFWKPFSIGKPPTRDEFYKAFEGSTLTKEIKSALYDDFSEGYLNNRKQFAKDALYQEGIARTDQELLQGVIDSYTSKLFYGGQQQSFSPVVSDTNKAQKVALAIKKTESGGNYQAKGASGEYGAYQFMPSTWSQWAKEFLGNANAPMTPENQDKVALAKIQSLINQGYNERQIALIWNGGTPVEKKGVNSKGVAYDSGAYANKVMGYL